VFIIISKCPTVPHEETFELGLEGRCRYERNQIFYDGVIVTTWVVQSLLWSLSHLRALALWGRKEVDERYSPMKLILIK